MSTVTVTKKAAKDACRQIEMALANLPCEVLHHTDDCWHDSPEPCRARNRLLVLLGVMQAYIEGPKGKKP